MQFKVIRFWQWQLQCEKIIKYNTAVVCHALNEHIC